MKREQKVFTTTPDLAEAAAARIVEILTDVLDSKPKASLVLTGGGTPRSTYQSLAERHRDALDWRRVALFWGDERFVPHEHEESNFGMAAETLLEGIEAGDVFPIPTSLGSPDEAASAYQRDIERYFNDGDLSFDLTLLGLGDDAHVASLFPGATELDEMTRLVVPTTAPEGSPITDRVSMTFRAINTSRTVLFIVAGANKGAAVQKALSGDRDVPAARVVPRERLIWFLDAEAADGIQ
jgi:6-phosphogluconolactonase